VRLNLPSHLPVQELPVPESVPSPSLSVSFNANNRHLISDSYLTRSNWTMPVCTSQSLPPLRPGLAPRFRQGWGCECTSRLAPPDLWFADPRIISSNPVSRAAVCFAINSTTSSTRVAPQTSLPTPKCQRQPPRKSVLPHESLAHPPPGCSHACLTQNCPDLGILRPRHLLGFDDHFAPPTSARNANTETMMMMSFICSCRNKNERKAIYPKGASHHTSLFRGPSTNDMKT
jgi:hypothetical protein